jgi:hypothetical protein
MKYKNNIIAALLTVFSLCFAAWGIPFCLNSKDLDEAINTQLAESIYILDERQDNAITEMGVCVQANPRYYEIYAIALKATQYYEKYSAFTSDLLEKIEKTKVALPAARLDSAFLLERQLKEDLIHLLDSRERKDWRSKLPYSPSISTEHLSLVQQRQQLLNISINTRIALSMLTTYARDKVSGKIEYEAERYHLLTHNLHAIYHVGDTLKAQLRLGLQQNIYPKRDSIWINNQPARIANGKAYFTTKPAALGEQKICVRLKHFDIFKNQNIVLHDTFYYKVER